MLYPNKRYATIPITVLLLCILLLWALPWMLVSAEFDRYIADLMLWTAIAVCVFGGVLGMCINSLLEKKLPRQSYEKLIDIVRALEILLGLLAWIVGMLRFGINLI